MNKINRLCGYWARAAGKCDWSSFDKSRPLAFMHIPKTSGSSIIYGLSAALTPAVEASGFDHSLFSNDKCFNTIDDSIRRLIYASPLSMPKIADFVHGHLALSTLIEVYPNAQRMTVLREPVSRVLSHWLFWRQHTDEQLASWGDHGDLVKIARKPLEVFLNEPILAAQTDNLMLRMLLWPHPLIRQDLFIDPIYDHRLLRQAMKRLKLFHFVDYIENDVLSEQISRWLGRPFWYNRLNETSSIPEGFRSPLSQELTSKAYGLLRARSRLDQALWTKVIGRSISDLGRLRDRTILANVSRYSVLMSC